MKKIVLFLVCLWSSIQFSMAQTDSLNSIDVNDIEVIVKSVRFSPNKDTVTIEMVLHSYLKDPREMKINTFASGLLSPQGKTIFYNSMMLGRVKIALADRKNYFNYLLKRNEPVLYTVKTAFWQKEWGLPKAFRITLEDRQDEGKFLQADISL